MRETEPVRTATLSDTREQAAIAARRHGVPHHDRGRAARCRAAGDWRGACAAADVEVRIDLGAIRRAMDPAWPSSFSKTWAISPTCCAGICPGTATAAADYRRAARPARRVRRRGYRSHYPDPGGRDTAVGARRGQGTGVTVLGTRRPGRRFDTRKTTATRALMTLARPGQGRGPAQSGPAPDVLERPRAAPRSLPRRQRRGPRDHAARGRRRDRRCVARGRNRALDQGHDPAPGPLAPALPVALPGILERIGEALPDADSVVLRPGGGAIVLSQLRDVTRAPARTSWRRRRPRTARAADPADRRVGPSRRRGPLRVGPLRGSPRACTRSWPPRAARRRGARHAGCTDDWIYGGPVLGVPCHRQCGDSRPVYPLEPTRASPIPGAVSEDTWQPVDHPGHFERESFLAWLGGNRREPVPPGRRYLGGSRHVIDLVTALIQHGRAETSASSCGSTPTPKPPWTASTARRRHGRCGARGLPRAPPPAAMLLAGPPHQAPTRGFGTPPSPTAAGVPERGDRPEPPGDHDTSDR